MSFDIDAEDKNVPYGESPGTPQLEKVENVQLGWRGNEKAPLQENKQQVLLELKGASSTGERLALDLVAVLDVSRSMDYQANGRLGKMKAAMQFVIKKLSHVDRLSIVTFSTTAKRLCHLRSMTPVSQAHLKCLIDGLEADGLTNIQDGFRTGLEILNDRRIAGGRVASIFLLSDEDQSHGDATIVDVSDVAVYTFGFGADSNHKVLGDIARKSKGGTFNFVEDGESMSEAVSQILGGLLSIVVQDLKLTVFPQPGDSMIEKVKASLYLQTRDTNTGSVTMSFGDLFATEVRKIIIDVLLPAIHTRKKVTTIIAYCTYSIKGKSFFSPEVTATIRRIGSPHPIAMINLEAMRAEQVRERYIENLQQTITLVDSQEFDSASNKLVEAKNDLQIEQSNTMIHIQRTQLDKLLELISSGTGLKALRACLWSVMMLHGRQRVAETGPVKGFGLFSTEFTGMYREQAKHHENNLAKEPSQVAHDDEDQNVPYAYYSPGILQQDTIESVRLVLHSNNTAPLQEKMQQVMLELIGASSTGERFGLDLVAVLDVSASMADENRIDKMKTAMQFVIKKLSPNDRLSIVTFSGNAERLCHLRSVTQASQEHLENLVDGLRASSATNMQAGLETAQKVLNHRRIAGGRVASIFLLSDGDQNIGDATIVDVSDMAVYTFGFGADSNHKVLGDIAMKSKGGTFNFVEDGESMSEPFSQILGGLLSIVVQDLKLTVSPSPKPGDSTIEKVNAGLYPLTMDPKTGSVTVIFGDLFAAEVRMIIIDVLLPAVHRRKKVTAIIASCTYSINGKPLVSREFTVTIRRTGSADPWSPISEAVITEQVRQIYIENLRQAIILADSVGLQGANNKLVDARNNLQLEQSNSLIDILRAQLDKLLQLISSGTMGLKALRACLLSMVMLHGRQRVAETGHVKGNKLYVTQFTDMSRKQAGDHEKDPTKVPPPASQDVEQAKIVLRDHEEDPTKVLLPVAHDVEKANIVRDQPASRGRLWWRRGSGGPCGGIWNHITRAPCGRARW